MTRLTRVVSSFLTGRQYFQLCENGVCNKWLKRNCVTVPVAFPANNNVGNSFDYSYAPKVGMLKVSSDGHSPICHHVNL